MILTFFLYQCYSSANLQENKTSTTQRDENMYGIYFIVVTDPELFSPFNVLKDALGEGQQASDPWGYPGA